MRKIVLTVLLLVLILGSSMLWVQHTYLFNPLTFRKNHITYLPWNWYKKPVVLEYAVLDDQNSWKVHKVTDQKEVKYVFHELEQSQSVNHSSGDAIQGIKEVIFRSSGDGIVLSVREETEQQVFRVENNTPHDYIKIPNSLMKLFNKRFAQAKSIN